MKPRSRTLFSVLATSILAGAPAAVAGSGDAVPDDSMPAIRHALEIAVAGTSSMPIGDVGGGMGDAGDVVGPGGELVLELGFRITPHFAVSAYGTVHGFSDGTGHGTDPDIGGGTAGLEVAFHTRPDVAVDPWISVGSGVRWLTIDDGGRSTLVGAELARLQLGVDFRMTENFALGPVLAASASMYQAQHTPMTNGYEAIADKGITWTFSAGVFGRFDAFGSRH
jgi:hypothetical protein